jgi:serine/threonine protein phosphatase 1
MGFLSRLFKPAPDLGHPKPDETIAVIGDVHGRDDLLCALLDQIDASGHTGPIVTVGDYVDRGDNSCAVIETLRARQSKDPRLTCLMGNHERMMLDFIDDPVRKGKRWLRYGGMETLMSFGVRGVTDRADRDVRRKGATDLEAAMGADALAWVRTLLLQFQSGNLWVVHAAADPKIELSKQSPETLLWGHEAFMSIPRIDGMWVAHGHTIVEEAHVQGSRIATDTGAWQTDILTAALIAPDGSVSFEQTST